MEGLPWSDKSLGAVWTPGLQFPCHPLTSEGTMKWGSDRGPGREEMDSSKKRWMGWGGDRLGGTQSEGPRPQHSPSSCFSCRSLGLPSLSPLCRPACPCSMDSTPYGPWPRVSILRPWGCISYPRFLSIKYLKRAAWSWVPYCLRYWNPMGPLMTIVLSSFLFSLPFIIFPFHMKTTFRNYF